MTARRVGPDRSPGHGIDRSAPITLTVDGRPVSAFAGDTVASAHIASGRAACGASLYLSRPRGIVAAGVEEPNALLAVDSRAPGGPSESMLPATTVEAVDGLSVRWLQGMGVLDPRGDDAYYDRKYVHTDVLVVGAGPAGIAAARESAKTGARTVLLDDQSIPGGSLLSGRGSPAGRDESIDGGDAAEWARATLKRLAAQPDFTYMRRTTAIGSYDANYIVAVERRADDVDSPAAPGVPRERVWHIRAKRVVLATGAHERPLVFADNDRPGVMLAGAVRTYLNRYAVAAGQNIILATTNDSVYGLLENLHSAGIAVPLVVDSRPEPSARARAALETTGTTGCVRRGSRRDLGGWEDAGASDDGATVEAPQWTRTGSHCRRGRQSHGGLVRTCRRVRAAHAATSRPIAADTLAVSGGHSPVLHLHIQRQGRTRWDDGLAAFVPEAPVAGQAVVGSANGAVSLGAAARAGCECRPFCGRGDRGAGAARGAHRLGGGARARAPTLADRPARRRWSLPRRRPLRNPAPTTIHPRPTTPHSHPSTWTTHFVDLQRDQTVADVLRAIGAGMRSVEHIKRYTSISTAGDQGKTSSVNAMGVIASLLEDADPASVGTSTNRPPYTPVAFAALAGRRRGELYEPARVTNIHPWHVAHGAEFEDVGQWKRPRYFPRTDEDMDAAVLRECAAVRTAVGIQDVSTLGKIEIRGADAPEFLNRIYTNGFAKLAGGQGALRAHVRGRRDAVRRRRDHAAG